MGKVSFNVVYIYVLMFVLLGSCEEDLINDDIRNKLEGTWSVIENNNLKSVDSYTVTINKSVADSTKIRIRNFYAINEVVEAVISDYDLAIPTQTVEGFTFEGYGVLSSNMKKIEWSYSVDHNNGFVDHVTATYTKN